MAWKLLSKTAEIARHCGISVEELHMARTQRRYIYIKRVDRRGKKPRNLCYPPPFSTLRAVQLAFRREILEKLTLSRAVRGYRKKQHNIVCGQAVAGFAYVGRLDLKDFHPSIRPAMVMEALRWHGLSFAMCRIIMQLVTFENAVPQGTTTSNHIANVVIDYILRQKVLAFCAARGVVVLNFGDDTAFGGHDQAVVDDCIELAKREFTRFGFVANSKSSSAQHVGGDRKFLGISTARATVDLPRKKFREYRKEFRAVLTRERDPSPKHSATEEKMHSLRGKVAYVRRMNVKKSRRLAELFHRLCRVKRDKSNYRTKVFRSPPSHYAVVVIPETAECPFLTYSPNPPSAPGASVGN